LGPPTISGWAEATNVKFYRRIKGNTKQKIKMGEKGAWSRSRDLLLNVGIPYYLWLG